LKTGNARGALAVSPNFARDNAVYYAHRRLWQSRDRGESWRVVRAPIKATARAGFAAGVDREGRTRLLLQMRGRALLALRDVNGTLEVARSDLPGHHTFGQVYGAPRDRTPLIRFVPTRAVPGLVIGASRDKLFRSDDYGQSWRELAYSRRISGLSKRVRFNGAWLQASGEQLAIDHLQYTSSPGAWFETMFQGSGVRWICSRFPASGIVAVTLNGQPYTKVDLHSPKAAYRQPCLSVRGLPRGKHHLRVTLLPGPRSQLLSLETLEVDP